ncbi:hypothetical protein FPOAC2_10292 [Fusarium poae]
MELEWVSGLGTEGGSSRHVCAVLLVQSQNFTLQGGHLFFTSFKAGQMLPFTKPSHSFGRPSNPVFLLRHLIAYFAVFCFILPPIHKLQSAGFSDAVLFVALFAKLAPPPITASPDNLVEVTHREKLSDKVKKKRFWAWLLGLFAYLLNQKDID